VKRSIVLLSALTLSACAGHDEVARVVSPDGAIDAVLVESNGGAITAFWYDIYLVRHGEPWRRAHSAAWLYDAMRSEQAYGVNIVWAAADSLEAQFSQATQTRLYRPEATVAGLPIKIVLRPGIVDASAPPGGMLYNRLGRPHDRS
jgi:hypothetical protein